MFGRVQHFEGARPLFASHVDDSQIRVGARNLRVKDEYSAKIALGLVKSPAFKSRFSLLKKLLRISILGERRRLSLLCRLSTPNLQTR